MAEKENKDMDEVLDEINSALNDIKGIASHQKRVGFCVSLGTIFLIEFYLRRLNVLKSGGKIDHRWLKKKKENAKKHISAQITCPIEELFALDSILNIAYKIESDRNKIVYGKEIDEKELRHYIDLFFKLKKEVEDV